VKIRKEFLPFSKPSIGKSEINKVITCLKSGWITTGARCKEFEDNFCQLTGSEQAISLNSATAGMHITLSALNIGPGDEIRVLRRSFQHLDDGNLIMPGSEVEGGFAPNQSAPQD
jgi:dTDP-4-amino-4,6-dideoxygalactose transaminase